MGFRVQGGAKAAVYAARKFLSKIPADHAVVKLDFWGAFNSIYRDKMLEATRNLTPDIFPFIHTTYSSSSHLYWGDRIILSAKGAQQGDPLGPHASSSG